MAYQKFCFVVPVCRNSNNVATLLEAIRQYNFPVILVDDGNSEQERAAIKAACDDYYSNTAKASAATTKVSEDNAHVSATSAKLSGDNAQASAAPTHAKVEDDAAGANAQALDWSVLGRNAKAKVHLVSYPEQQGRGYAIAQGLFYAFEQGYTHAIELDADLRYDFEDIKALILRSLRFPPFVISGDPQYDDNTPLSRIVGSKLHNFMAAFETLTLAVKDCTCSFRVYPVASAVACLKEDGFRPRVGFDIDILIKLYRRGLIIDYIDTKVKYIANADVSSSTLADKLALIMMHTVFMLNLPLHFKGILYHKQKPSRINSEETDAMLLAKLIDEPTSISPEALGVDAISGASGIPYYSPESSRHSSDSQVSKSENSTKNEAKIPLAEGGFASLMAASFSDRDDPYGYKAHEDKASSHKTASADKKASD
ncbi:glycosyltransferase family 2 protein [Anaerobiospirillum succiniciproducens]|uniref:glycosyltransferase family 2 protein n=1 Tax=Anaerobiospirillum succiniciproducens TaxID=13335 RepID=UPI002354C514|nr:hypothetical protein [Anaerobiospirillum succiniciproducens]MCI6863163.1 hypothetical protein [Anaerobiospirillum succiniciproducens]